MPTLALIVNTFNQPEYLDRVLNAIERQTVKPDELLIADDGSEKPTRDTITSFADKGGLEPVHVWQPHEGFRRSRILNEAIARSRSDYIVFLDGDTVPHPRFVEDHHRAARESIFVQGHRALLKESGARWFGSGEFGADRRRALFTFQLQGLKHAFRWPSPWVRERNDLRGIRGCNLGIWRKDLIAVNGYNEAFVGWGREDSELAVRLMNLGRKRLDLRGRALCYHLWHPPASRAQLEGNDHLLAESKSKSSNRAEQGLANHLEPRPADPVE